MSTELALPDNKLPLVMKGGVVHWVSPELHARIQEQLMSQDGHSFIKLKELSATINTAQIEGVYTLEQYTDMTRIKEGQWQCAYRTWHPKRGECECKREAEKAHRQAMDEAKRIQDSKPRTPEEQATIDRALARNRQILEEKGLIKSKMTKGFLKRSALVDYEKRHGVAYNVPEGTHIEEDVPMTPVA